MAKSLTRRSFLKKSAATVGALTAAGIYCPPNILAEAPNSKPGIAVIGCGGAGGGNPGTAANNRCIALCDVDDNTLAKAAERIKDKLPKPKTYHDYRKMLDECHKDIDVVLIATPDHHHAPAAIRAIELDKHVFVQKPLAHNIRECRIMAKAAEKHKVHTQMGNQGHCGEGYRRLCEYIWAGAIGDVLETHSILGRNFGGTGGRPQSKPVPPNLHWDQWLGPAPYRDYHDNLHPFNWRSWRQFGTGTLGDMACHVMDGVFWALKLNQVDSYSIQCLSQTPGSDEMFPQNNILRWDFPARASMPAVKVFSYDNSGNKPEIIKKLEAENNRRINNGTLYVGTKGYMYTDTYGGGVRIIPEEKHKAFPVPEKSIPRVSGGPIGNLLNALKTGTAPCSNFINPAGPFTEMILTGQLAMFAGPGQKIKWNGKEMTCDIADLNKFTKRTYRKGWEV